MIENQPITPVQIAWGDEDGSKKWIGHVIMIGAVVLAALPVAATDPKINNPITHQGCLANDAICQRVVDERWERS